jgi:hypothetical protein
MFVVMVFALLVDLYDYDTGATGATSLSKSLPPKTPTSAACIYLSVARAA